MRTYVPTFARELHQLAVYLARWNAVLRPAIAAIDPAALPDYDALFTAVIALDAIRETLDPTHASP